MCFTDKDKSEFRWNDLWAYMLVWYFSMLVMLLLSCTMNRCHSQSTWPYSTYINDENNDCASTMFSYINLPTRHVCQRVPTWQARAFFWARETVVCEWWPTSSKQLACFDYPRVWTSSNDVSLNDTFHSSKYGVTDVPWIQSWLGMVIWHNKNRGWAFLMYD